MLDGDAADSDPRPHHSRRNAGSVSRQTLPKVRALLDILAASLTLPSNQTPSHAAADDNDR